MALSYVLVGPIGLWAGLVAKLLMHEDWQTSLAFAGARPCYTWCTHKRLHGIAVRVTVKARAQLECFEHFFAEARPNTTCVRYGGKSATNSPAHVTVTV